jgi:hypothetical protein
MYEWTGITASGMGKKPVQPGRSHMQPLSEMPERKRPKTFFLIRITA